MFREVVKFAVFSQSARVTGFAIFIAALVGSTPDAQALDRGGLVSAGKSAQEAQSCPASDAVAILSTQKETLESLEALSEIDEYQDSAKTTATKLAHTPSCSSAGGHRVCAIFPYYWPCMCGNQHLSSNLRRAGCTCVIGANGGQRISCPGAQ